MALNSDIGFFVYIHTRCRRVRKARIFVNKIDDNTWRQFQDFVLNIERFQFFSFWLLQPEKKSAIDAFGASTKL